MRPLVELHLHIEGTLEPELTFELAARNGITLPYRDAAHLRELMDFQDLPSFLDLYYRCCAVLQTTDDFRDLMTAYLRRAVADGVRHAEIFFDPQTHTSRGVPIDTVLDGLLEGIRIVGAESDISGGLILCFLRDRPVEEASAALDSVGHRLGDLVGVGLDSAEVGYPPRLFAEVFARARACGLHVVAHAGEEGGPEYVVDALDSLGAERIDHGIRSIEDNDLVERLRRDRVPLTVCPFSNVRLRAVDRLVDHPLARMLDAGVNVSVNSDDPAYFGGYIGQNLEQTTAALGLTDAQVTQLLRNAIESSFLSEVRKAELVAEL